MYYLKYFVLTSIIGFVLETIFYTGDSGILFGPWTVVYGLGSVIILILYKLIIQKLKLNQFLEIIIFFVSCVILLSLIELIGGYLIEWIFNISFWDYSHCMLHIGKYICFQMSLLWGIASLAFIYLLKPVLDNIIKFVPNIFFILVLGLMIVDLIVTFIIKH